MNSEFINALKQIEGIELSRNIYTQENEEKALQFIQKYPFVKKDRFYFDFLHYINGFGISSPDFLLFLYGFALREVELIFALDEYMDELGFLVLGEYVEKRVENKWDGISYHYHKKDESPIIYARFYAKDIKESYYPLCIGFNNLIPIITTKNFMEQFELTLKD